MNLNNLDKNELRKEFSKNYSDYYATKLFDDQGFKRRRCIECGKNFWSITERETCDDPSHTSYSFFKEKPKEIGYKAFWDRFAKFFEENGHKVIGRYPVVSRWRQDLYFTIASIQDFQRIENGAMSFEYSANPLIVPQICLRFGDIENVGITGRHLTGFMMAGQHAFDWPKEGYWRDRTIELNFNFLTKVLGVKKEDLVYSEDVWAMGDFSEFGPCLESFSNGLELVNSVFTQYESVGGQVRDLKNKVVDVGWGFERLLWFHTGMGNVYEAIFSDLIKKLGSNFRFDVDRVQFRKFEALAGELDVTEIKDFRAKEAKILKSAGISQEQYSKGIRPLQASYAILDHVRTLLFAITDGALPSNVGGGYNLRVILRRSLSFIDEYNLGLDLNQIAKLEADELKGLYPELENNLNTFSAVLESEGKRYYKTRENANRVITALVGKGKRITRDELKMLYESHGITPEFISSVAYSTGEKIDIPEGAYADIVKSDFVAKEKKGKGLDIDIELVTALPKTEQLYYKFATDSDSKILYVHRNYIILDRTPFYPEGGGQEADKGTINGYKIVDAQKIGDVIMHITEIPVENEKGMKIGSIVKCQVDVDRRERLMAHHTVTHLMSAAARKIIGKHAWQEGTRKQAEKAHIDIVHYDKLSGEQINLIENFVNDAVWHGINVTVEHMKRSDAEKSYGFSIYQGHGVPSKIMRIVIIKDKRGKLIDAEACGGTHVESRESLIGSVKIINTYRIHDGVDRIEFVAGKAGIDYFRMEHGELSRVAEKLNSERFKVVDKISKLEEDYSNLMKSYSEKENEMVHAIANTVYSAHIKGSDRKEFVLDIEYSRDIIRKVLTEIIEKNKDIVILAKNKSGEAVSISGDSSKKDALEFARHRLGEGFRGGGSKRIAEGMAG